MWRRCELPVLLYFFSLLECQVPYKENPFKLALFGLCQLEYIPSISAIFQCFATYHDWMKSYGVSSLVKGDVGVVEEFGVIFNFKDHPDVVRLIEHHASMSGTHYLYIDSEGRGGGCSILVDFILA